ncbi:YrdC domain-containing protein, mitochondrial [Manis javanica]|nr:YrdC domain-containing protein, mitochondrial [Manis javanica]
MLTTGKEIPGGSELSWSSGRRRCRRLRSFLRSALGSAQNEAGSSAGRLLSALAGATRSGFPAFPLVEGGTSIRPYGQSYWQDPRPRVSPDKLATPRSFQQPRITATGARSSR